MTASTRSESGSETCAEAELIVVRSRFGPRTHVLTQDILSKASYSIVFVEYLSKKHSILLYSFNISMHLFKLFLHVCNVYTDEFIVHR